MIVLDTNVVSEAMRPAPNVVIVGWLDAQPPNELYVCTPVLAELRYGIARLRPSRRKERLLEHYGRFIAEIFVGRILAFDAPAAEAYGDIVAEREKRGRPISVVDAMIAAIVRTNRAILATRNIGHFEDTGFDLINPFGAD